MFLDSRTPWEESVVFTSIRLRNGKCEKVAP